MQEWYEPRAVFFNREQVIWLLSWLPTLIEGNWPSDPRGTGYTDAPIGRGSRSRHAPFETPAQVAGELEIRLGRLGLDRYLVEDRYTNEITEEAIAQKLGISPEEVYRRINSALWYITGWRRKRLSYQDWKKQGRYRKGDLLSR